MDILDFTRLTMKIIRKPLPLKHIPGIHRQRNERSLFIIGLGFGLWGMLENSEMLTPLISCPTSSHVRCTAAVEAGRDWGGQPPPKLVQDFFHRQ